MLKLRTLFSGVGSPEMALKALGVNYELVDFCEVDKYAVKSYCAIHNTTEDKNLGDITKVWGRGLEYADMLVWGFPCQDISVAGNQKGVIEGETRSGLYYDGKRILHETKPKYSIIENVKNLTSKKFKPVFDRILSDLEEEGYNNYWQVLNAKDYGIPQNRERVFIVSIRKDVDKGNFKFPEVIPLELKLKDMLEVEVEEKYYISQDKTSKLIEQLKEGKKYHSQDISYAIDANYHKGASQSDLTNGKRQTIMMGKQIAQTLNTGSHQATLTSCCRIRKLIPLECWRLMGFSDEDFYKAKAVNSDAQLYKQAGNSIVKHVLMGIFKNLLEV